MEENLLNELAVDPSISIRSLALQNNATKSTIGRVIKEQLLHPYHLQKVQALSPVDFPARLQFSQWFVQNHQQNPRFHQSILYTDEAGFGRNLVFNCHNSHFWADENPHATIATRHQRQFHINIWAGIIGSHLLGPIVLPPRLNGQLYHEFLLEQLPLILEDVDLQTRLNMWFMHDGAPPHFSLMAREHLNNAYPNRWIGRGGPIPWPPRSPDLNPLDFFLWGHLKSLVYATPVETREELQERIIHHSNGIKRNHEMLWRVQQSTIRRALACIREEGAHIEHSL